MSVVFCGAGSSAIASLTASSVTSSFLLQKNRRLNGEPGVLALAVLRLRVESPMVQALSNCPGWDTHTLRPQ